MERNLNVVVFLRGQLWTRPLVLSVPELVLVRRALASAPFRPRGWDAGQLRRLHGGEAGSDSDLLPSLLSGPVTVFSLVVSVPFVILTLAARDIMALLIHIVDILGQLPSVLRPGAAREAVFRQLGRLAKMPEEVRLTPCGRTAVLVRTGRARITATNAAKEDNVHVL